MAIILTRFVNLPKNETVKEVLKLQEAHEGQQALLPKLQVCSMLIYLINRKVHCNFTIFFSGVRPLSMLVISIYTCRIKPIINNIFQ